MKRIIWPAMGVVVGILSACATSPPLISEQSVAHEVRQAATCYAFNANAEKYLFGVQKTMNDYDEAATFWERRFLDVEPDPAFRSKLNTSANRKMDTDFPRRSAPQDSNVEIYNAVYGTVIAGCERQRAELEAKNG